MSINLCEIAEKAKILRERILKEKWMLVNSSLTDSDYDVMWAVKRDLEKLGYNFSYEEIRNKLIETKLKDGTK